MDARKSFRSAVLVAGILLWIGLFAWLGFLYRFDRTYQRTYFAWLRSHLAIPQYSPPAPIPYRDQKGLVWYSFWEPETGFRWSYGKRSAVLFRLDGEAAQSARVLRFDTACSLGPQEVDVVVNDQRVGSVMVNGAGTFRLSLPPRLLAAGANSVEFLVPGARTPPDHIDDHRVLGIGVSAFALEPGSHTAKAQPASPLRLGRGPVAGS